MPYVAYRGIKWGKRNIAANNTVQTMNFDTIPAFPVYKTTLEVNCIPLTTEDAKNVLDAIKPRYIAVEVDEPDDGNTFKTMICDVYPSPYLHHQKNGTDYWGGISFILIEK